MEGKAVRHIHGEQGGNKNRLTLADYILHYTSSRNVLTKLLTGQIPSSKDILDVHNEHAIENLERFVFVGIQEYFDESVQLFKWMFGQTTFEKPKCHNCAKATSYSSTDKIQAP